MRLKELQQLKRFPPGLKSINRSPLKFWKEDRRNAHDSQVHVEVDHREAIQLLTQLRKQRKRPQKNDPQLHWPFTPSKDKENIETPPLLSTSDRRRPRGSRNASVSRLHFSRKLAEAAPCATVLPGPSKVPNSCPSEPSSTATRDIADLCGTASLKRYQLPVPPSMPSGMSDPPPLDVEQEIEMWEEEAGRCQRREMTPPDDIQQDMSSWALPVKENQPAAASRALTVAGTPPASRQVLGDITSQFAHAPTPSLSGMDLTGHLMALIERLEPMRTPPRRAERRRTERLKPPHQTLQPKSVASIVPQERVIPRSQPLPVRAESSSPPEVQAAFASAKDEDSDARDDSSPPDTATNTAVDSIIPQKRSLEEPQSTADRDCMPRAFKRRQSSYQRSRADDVWSGRFCGQALLTTKSSGRRLAPPPLPLRRLSLRRRIISVPSLQRRSPRSQLI